MARAPEQHSPDGDRFDEKSILNGHMTLSESACKQTLFQFQQQESSVSLAISRYYEYAFPSPVNNSERH
jgi:hypothetical protein